MKKSEVNQKNKQIIVIMLGLILLIIAGVFFIKSVLNSKDDKYVKLTDENSITRYEWIQMLCEQSGLTEYQNEEPYYEDVNTSNAYFSYIQSAVEWGVLVNDTKFEGDGYASGNFIALTAMKTIGEKKLGMYLDTKDAITDDVYIGLAIEHELIEEKQLTEGFSKEECEQVLKSLTSIYFSEFWRDDYSNITYQDDVIELSSDDVLQRNMDGSEIVVSDNIRNTLETGMIIVFEQENTKLKFAREISGIDADGAVALKPAELNQVVESLTVSDITELSFEDIVNCYETEEIIYTANNLEHRLADETAINTNVFPIDKNSKGFKISLSTEGKENDKHLEIQVTDNLTRVTKALPINYKVEQDSEYSAEINIDKVLIGGQVSYEVLHGGLQYMDIAVDVDSTFKGTIKTEEEKKVPILKTPVSIGNGIASIDIQIYLVLSVDGEVSFEAELPTEVSLYFEKDKGFRNFRHDILPKNPRVEANCDAEAVFRFEPTMSRLRCIDIVDMEADIGVTASAKVATHPTAQVCADVSISFPVITISVCGDDEADTIVGDMGLSAEWEVISPENAPYQIGLHYEHLPDGSEQFVDECTYMEGTDGNDELINQTDVILNNTYSTKYNNADMEWTPIYSFDYPDNWNVVSETYEEANDICLTLDTFAQEVVVLANERGVTVSFIRIDNNIFSLGGQGAIFEEYTASEVEDNTFFASTVVAKIQCVSEGFTGTETYDSVDDGNVLYALIPRWDDNLFAFGITGLYKMVDIGIDYDTAYNFFAESPDGRFTEKEEKEVIAILQSFRSGN